MSIKFSAVAGTLPSFNTQEAAFKFVAGFVVPRVVVKWRNRYFVCSPSTARRCYVKVVKRS